MKKNRACETKLLSKTCGKVKSHDIDKIEFLCPLYKLTRCIGTQYQHLPCFAFDYTLKSLQDIDVPPASLAASVAGAGESLYSFIVAISRSITLIDSMNAES